MLWRQSAWFTVEALSSSLMQLVLGAWLIRVLGLAAYGEWVAALALVNLSVLAAWAVAPGLSLQVQAEGDASRAPAWLGAAVVASLPPVVVLLGITSLATGGPLRTALFGALAVHACGNAVAMLAAAALRGRAMHSHAALWTLALRVLAAIAVGIAALAGATLGGLVLASAATMALQALVLCALLRRDRVPLAPAPAPAPASLQARAAVLLSMARFQWLKSAGSLLFGAGDRVLVGQVLGPAALAVYGVCVMLAEPLARLASMLAQPLLLWAGRVRALGDSLGRHWRAFVVIELAIVAAGLLAALVLPLVLPLWLGAATVDHVPALWLAIAASTLLALHAVVNHLLAGSGANRAFGWASLLGGLGTLAVMRAAAPAGIEAVIAARLVYGLALFAGWPALHRLARPAGG